MRIRTGLFVFILLVSSVLIFPVWALDNDLPAIKVAVSDDQSIIIERILYAALKRSGYQLVVQITGMRTAVADVNYGDAVILPIQTEGWDRLYPNLIRVPVAITNVEFTAYSLNRANHHFSDWSDMAGLRLGYRWQNEYVANNVWRAEAGSLATYNEIAELWESLINGATDVVVLPRISHYEHGLPNGIVRAGIVERQPVYSYVNYRHDYLVPLLEKAYLEMIADGTMDLINYGTGKNNLKPDQEFYNDKPLVLHINSYSAQNAWEHNQMDSIHSEIERLLDNGKIVKPDYLSYNLNSNELIRVASYNAIISSILRTNFVSNLPDLIIASGDEALEYVLENYYLIFPNTPVLFYGVHEQDETIPKSLGDNITGVYKTVSFIGTVSQILKMYPGTRRIFILNDHHLARSILLRGYLDNIIRSSRSTDLSVDIIFNDDKPFVEILENIRWFGSDTIVLIGSYLSDNGSNFYSEIEVQNMVSQVSSQPVFSLVSSYVGNGTLGALIPSVEIHSNIVASMAVEILTGKKPSEVPVIYDLTPFHQWHFDHETAKRFSINTKTLPPGHIILNRPLPIWESNPLEFTLIMIVAGLILLLFIALTAVIYTLSKKKADKIYITNIEKAQEELRFARDAAQTANRTKSTFLANMSHEIRTPMNSIIGFAELAQYNDNSQKIKEYIKYILESANWLLKIINDILDISKIESGKITLEKIPFDLHDVLSACQVAIKPKAEEKGIAFYCYAEPSINKKLLGDPIRLRQVIINLLSNAVKFTNTGTVKLLAFLEEINDNSALIRFEIKDSGIGMNPSQIARILEPFMQGDDSITRRFGGTGLGLSITKNIIEMMGSVLVIESAQDIGSKFSFNIKFKLIEEAASIILPADISDTNGKPNFSGDVLICEDNSLNQQVMSDHLSRLGLNSVIAHNGREGIERVTERIKSGSKQFDLILMDVHMPVMDGLECSSRLTEMGIKTPIVAVTANIMSNDVELYRTSGMSDCLGKPFTSQDLWKCLLKYLPVKSFSAIDNKQQASFDEKLLERMRLDFVKNNQNTFLKINNAIDDGDIKLAHRIAHSLKSNAGQIFEKELQAAAEAAEAMLEFGRFEPKLFENEKFKINSDILVTLEKELTLVLKKLSPLLQRLNAQKIYKNNDAEKILGILNKLEPLIKNKNPECEDLIGDVLTIPDSEALAEQIENYHFKQAAAELTKLINKWEPKK